MADPDALEYHRKQVVANRRAQAPAPRQQVPASRPRNTSSRGVTTTATGRYTRPSPPPVEGPGPVPTIEAYLGGDVGYQDQIRQFGKALADFTADVTRRQGNLESQFGVSKKGLEDQRVKDLKTLEEDYGSRGLLRSGLYGTAVGDYETEYGTRVSDLSRQQQEALAALTQEQGQFTSQQQLQQELAKQEAIRRRAEKYGV